ncbi:transcription-repair coupling factor [Spirochaeta africana]|uniref:Transcription-repair-coupling factor n=1 Tax=Spirochaeta africana (strain ATCC 700263 / DSM 8902 / Z-7692) TaxID=889378 RepID=H9UJ40_SPIAZ|nr:transcription-repair coupling factor [Spirochaeta africana]AFG37533.1 transcription-repair coupling factor Mfd [Spirochaeta africana DSM 8902]
MKTLLFDAISAQLKGNRNITRLDTAVQESSSPLQVTGLQGSFLTYYLARMVRNRSRSVMLVVPSEREVDDTVRDLQVLGVEAISFPWYGTMPYHPVPANSAAHGQRMRVLTELSRSHESNAPYVCVTSMRAAMAPVPPAAWIRDHSYTLQVGQNFDPVTAANRLAEFDYSRVNRVSLRGEYALRGEVLDVFPPGAEHAVRVVFEFDTIEDIRLFDPATQTSVGRQSAISFYPVREVLWEDERLNLLEQRLTELMEFPDNGKTLLEHLKETRRMEREEVFFPLSFPDPHSVLEYPGSDTLIVLAEYERLHSAADGILKEYESLHRKTRTEGKFPLPENLLCSFSQLEERLPRVLRAILLNGTHTPDLRIAYDGPRSFFGNIEFLREELENLQQGGYRILVGAESEMQAARIQHLLQDETIAVLPQTLQGGFTLPEAKLALLQENEIFGRRKRTPSSVQKTPSQAIETFVELEPGDLVVHVNYGIGRFRGIQRIRAGGNERDYIHLEYAGDEFIYIPIEQVNLIQRYIGQQGSAPRLDKIGGKSWENRKSKVRRSVEDLAERLVQLYSRRKQARGYAFPPDTDWQLEFEASFPYEETLDQLRCIEEVKADMEQPSPMDRLVCGDVGFGKTEIALRAAFKSVTAGKQVALLAPTTILAEQHFENLEERLARFPIRTGMLSRFVTPAQQKKVIAGLKSGEIDLVIGTHRILSRDVEFRDLGLIVVDEEQRFGVKHKERLKEMKTTVDSLTLSATPIPRTLHMSLLKIRDMSVLQTPPTNRMPIETVIREFDEDIVAAAIRKEIERGGQVYFLHNRVETLEYVRKFIEKLVPEVMVDVAHGQMTAHQLEDIMHRFIHGAFQVLVATSIIENGIDIPNVNTIIIDRADNFGISQLYQLRGRVGRSDRSAYAYLLYPEDRPLSEIAMKRLQVISDHTELGSGFKVAMKDLEVRGAGNLLGPQQSGDILSVGFDLYLRLLDEAIRRLQSEGDYIEDQEVYLELEYTGFIPDEYIDDPMEKMEVYKKIASINTDTELATVTTELEDRFGPLPDEVHSLLSLAEIRIICRRLHISSLRERRGRVTITFERVAHLDVDKVLEAIRVSGGAMQLDPKNPQNLVLQSESVGLKEKSEFIRGKLSSLL